MKNPTNVGINRNIQWRTRCLFLDIETGENITKEEAEKNYTIIKTDKYTHYGKSRGTIEYTKQCRRKPRQGTIFEISRI